MLKNIKDIPYQGAFVSIDIYHWQTNE